MIRMQAKGLKSLETGESIGSVVFADSYFRIENQISINLTQNVPVIQAWYSNHKHFENMRVPL
jgi:hypothetical protein